MAAAQTPDAVVERIKAGPSSSRRPRSSIGLRPVRAELIALTEIPAPPFKEDARGAAYLEMLKDAGLTDVERDAEGNVMGVWRGSNAPGGPMLAVLSHLDTVFPEGTDVKVKRTARACRRRASATTRARWR